MAAHRFTFGPGSRAACGEPREGPWNPTPLATSALSAATNSRRLGGRRACWSHPHASNGGSALRVGAITRTPPPQPLITVDERSMMGTMLPHRCASPARSEDQPRTTGYTTMGRSADQMGAATVRGGGAGGNTPEVPIGGPASGLSHCPTPAAGGGQRGYPPLQGGGAPPARPTSKPLTVRRSGSRKGAPNRPTT